MLENQQIIREIIEYLSLSKSQAFITLVSDDLYQISKEAIKKDVEIFIGCLLSILNKYKIKLNTSVLNILFLYYQMSESYKYILESDKKNNNIENNFALELYNICDTYNICEDYKNYLDKNIISNYSFKTENTNLNKYRDLCIK